MSEQEKQQIGDGSDNYGHAVNKLAKQMGHRTVQQGAEKSAKTAADIAAATVQAGVESGKAAAGVAAGTAIGGPFGAALSMAWELRHTLFKVLVSICLALVFLIVLIVSLPSIVFDNILGTSEDTTLNSSYTRMAERITQTVNQGRDYALSKVEQIIEEGNYDYDLTMDRLTNYANSSAGFDTGYILAAYSASMGRQRGNENDLIGKMESVVDKMFPVTYEEKKEERVEPVTYFTYKPINVTVVTAQIQTGTVKGVPQYRYETAEQTYFIKDVSKTSNEEITVDAYVEVEVKIPLYDSGKIIDTKLETYYLEDGEMTLRPQKKTIKYADCTIHPFDNSVIEEAFQIDLDAQYDQFGITYGEAITNMANALKMTLYGSYGGEETTPAADLDLVEFVNSQNCNNTRKYIVITALKLVGKVPYFWGGKSGPGWNDEWNTPKLVTAAGSSTTGMILPYGLDCSGFSTWVYSTALGVSIGTNTSGQYPNTTSITADELLPGDLGFLAKSNGNGWDHVLIFAGYDSSGKRLWVHCTNGKGVVINTPSYDASLVLRRLRNVDYDAPVQGNGYGEPLETMEVDVTHYCACEKCCGKNATGITASGKQVTSGMVAMSSYYPFGTQIMINGTLYTVEDRGDAGIEQDIHRVDIYVPDHEQALRMGRYKTSAVIYKIGR